MLLWLDSQCVNKRFLMSNHYEFKNAKWNELNMPFNDS